MPGGYSLPKTGKQVCILSRSLGNYLQVLHPQGRIRQGSLSEFLLGNIGFVGGSGAAQQVGLAVSQSVSILSRMSFYFSNLYDRREWDSRGWTACQDFIWVFKFRGEEIQSVCIKLFHPTLFEWLLVTILWWHWRRFAFSIYRFYFLYITTNKQRKCNSFKQAF